MCVTNFLAPPDAAYMNNGLNVNDLYRQMLRMYGGNFVVNGIHLLLKGGYITRCNRDNVTYFTVTDKFVEVMRCFA